MYVTICSSLSDKVLKSTGRGAASLAHKRSLSKLCIPPVERKLTDQTCDFLAVAGLGFDENEYQNIFKAPPRFPRKMIVKREDVVQVIQQSVPPCNSLPSAGLHRWLAG